MRAKHLLYMFIIILLLSSFLNILVIFNFSLLSDGNSNSKENSESLMKISEQTKVLIIYGDHDSGIGGQRYNEIKSYLIGFEYVVDTIHISSFILDPSMADTYNVLVIDRSLTTSHATIKATGKPILAFGYGGGLFFTNALGFPMVATELYDYIDNNHKILTSHRIFTTPNSIGSPPSIIQPVYYGSSWSGEGREYYFEISGLLAGSRALLDYYYDNTERTTRTILFAYNISSTQKTVFWGYNSYYPGGGGYVNCITSPLGLNLLQNIIEYLKGSALPEEIEISNVINIPLYPSSNESVRVNATITCKNNISNVQMYYKINNGSYTIQEMTLMEGTNQLGTWQGTIPGQSFPSMVNYYVYAENSMGYSIKVGPLNYTIYDFDSPVLSNFSQIPIFPTDKDSVNINISLSDLAGINKTRLFYIANKSKTPEPFYYEETKFNITNSQSANIRIVNNETIELNKTGNYPGYYSFTNDVVGGNPSGWSYYEYSPTTHIDVVSGLGSHNKVVELWDNTATGYCYMTNSFTSRTTGAVEFYVQRKSGWSGGLGALLISLRETGSRRTGIYLNNYKLDTYGGTNIIPSGNWHDNQWYHFRLIFDCNLDQVQIWVNGTNFGVYSFSSVATYINSIEIYTYSTDTTGNTYLYVDAIDYSWATGYYINRNMNDTYYSNGFYRSRVFDLGEGSQYFYQNLTFYRTLNPNTALTLQYRTSSDNISWSSWSSSFSTNITLNQVKSRYLQFNLSLTSLGTLIYTPQCAWVKFTYLRTVIWETIDFTLLQGDIHEGIWNGTIPAFGNGTVIYYYIYTQDKMNNSLVFPKGVPSNVFGYIVGIMDNEIPPIESINVIPSTPTYRDNVTITALVNFTSEISGIDRLILCYSKNNTVLNNILMDYNIKGDYSNYSAILPCFSYNNIIIFNITAYDRCNNSVSSDTYNFTIADRDSPQFISCNQNPARPDVSENVQINVTTYEPSIASGVKNVSVYYSMTETSPISIESPHPVPDSYSYTWNISVSNGLIDLLYFENISLEDGYDFLYIYNASYGLIASVTGNVKHYTVRPNDNVVRVQLITDMVINSWGFFISMIKIRYNLQTLPLICIKGDEYNGNWTIAIPAKQNITSVLYYFRLFDYAGNSLTSNIFSYISAEKVLPIVTQNNRTPAGPYVLPKDSPLITVTISDNLALNHQNSACLQYTTSSTIWTNISMTYLGESYFPKIGLWSANIPSKPDGSQITYRFLARDLANNSWYSANFSYICDGASPILKSAKVLPTNPNSNESVLIIANLTDVYPSFLGSGIRKVSIEYSYTSSYILDSPHPYPNNYTQKSFIYSPSALGLSIHFSSVILAPGDFILIRDEHGMIVDALIMSVTNYWTPFAYTNNLTIEFLTDTAGTAYGFSVDQILTITNSTSQLESGSIHQGTWEGVIPCFPYGTAINFQVIATDYMNNSANIYTGSYVVGDTIPPQLISCRLSIENPTPEQDITITVQVSEAGAGIQNVTLYLSVNRGLSWYCLNFENESSELWICTIPRQPDNTLVKYYIIIFDKNGNYLRNPTLGSEAIIFQSPPSLPYDIYLWILLASIGLVTVLLAFVYFRSRRAIQREVEIRRKKYVK